MGIIMRRFLRNQTGAGLIEMALLMALIAIATLAAVQFAGDSNSELWSEIGSGLAST